MPESTEEYDRAGAFMRGPENGDRYVLAYTASTSGTVQHVEGEVDDGHLGEYTRVTTDVGVRYTVCGFGLANRETGEVLKETDNGSRKVGEFEYANKVRQ